MRDLQEAWCEPRFLSTPFLSTPFFEYPFLEYPLPTTRFTAGQCEHHLAEERQLGVGVEM